MLFSSMYGEFLGLLLILHMSFLLPLLLTLSSLSNNDGQPIGMRILPTSQPRMGGVGHQDQRICKDYLLGH